MRAQPAGDDAVLLDFTGDPVSVRRATALLTEAVASGALTASDVVPTAHSILVSAEPGTGIDALAVRRVIRDTLSITAVAGTRDEPTETVVPVVYDGVDLAAAAALAGVGADELIRAHSAIRWRVQFMGFAPGFGYLIPDEQTDPADAALFSRIGRRDASRPAVPTGSVALAAGYSAVYPRSSPGGWQLIGRTDVPMWNVDAEPPALLAPGRTVRFSCAD
ncbi:MAG: carboxyltransferase domain-containing protein [Gordonia sp. (in: high G+C Gram-positive bacteria)]